MKQRVVTLGARSYESQVRLTGIVDDIARAWRVVRTFDVGEFKQARFAAEAKRFRHATVKSVATAALMSPLTQLVASLGVALIITLALPAQGRGARRALPARRAPVGLRAVAARRGAHRRGYQRRAL